MTATTLPSLATAHTTYPANKFSTYANIGVSLSGLAVQMQSGKKYEDYMHDFLLKPLQMVYSNFSGQLTGPGAAVGQSRGEVVEDLAGRDLPAGGLISTVDDMANFATAMLGKGRFGDEQILTPDSIAEMLRAQNTDMPLDLAVRPGLGCSYNFNKLVGRFKVVGNSGG